MSIFCAASYGPALLKTGQAPHCYKPMPNNPKPTTHPLRLHEAVQSHQIPRKHIIHSTHNGPLKAPWGPDPCSSQIRGALQRRHHVLVQVLQAHCAQWLRGFRDFSNFGSGFSHVRASGFLTGSCPLCHGLSCFCRLDDCQLPGLGHASVYILCPDCYESAHAGCALITFASSTSHGCRLNSVVSCCQQRECTAELSFG